MRTLATVLLTVFLSGSLFAQQYRSGVVGAPRPIGPPAAPGNTVVAPPSITIPTGVNPNFRPGSVGFGFNGFQNQKGFRGNRNGAVAAYPVYVGGYGGYYDPSMYDGSYYGGQPAPQQPPQQPGSVTVIYPPPPAPVIINQFGPPDSQYSSSVVPRAMPAPPPVQSQTSEPSDNEPAHFLIALKDHTIYSAVAYWVEGDTLHYFTNGNTHNQVSVSLIDRDLTARLNRDSGVEVKLPALK